MATTLDKLLADGCSADAKHKVCRSRGGESCAFDGAAIVLMPIADAAHVVHGPIACCANTWQGRGVHSAAGEFHRRGFTTDLEELDIVYGASEKLEATVREVVETESPKAVFVYATCVTGLIGEDLDAVCAKLAAGLSVPIVPVHAPGFVGPKNLGNRIAGEALLEHVIGTAEPVCETPTDIVLIGEYNVAGDLDLIEPLLRECGIRTLSRITGNATFEEIRWAHRAKLSVTVCSRALVNVAASLQRRWSIPNVEVSFFGPTETARSLRIIAAALESASPDAVGVVQRVEAAIARHDLALAGRLAAYADALTSRSAVLYSGGVKSWSMVSCLRDLGIDVVAVGSKKTSAEDEEKLAAIAPDLPVLEDTSPGVLRQLIGGIGGSGADILVAGGRNRYLAAKEGWPFVDVNQERETAYAVYEGFVNLARDLAHSVRFYERQSQLHACGSRRVSEVRTRPGRGVVDPLKTAPSLGAALALQGVERALPVLHGAQGCAFLEKVLAIRHFNEPIALATTKLFTQDVVLASEEAAVTAARQVADAAKPDLLAIVSTALAEVKGDDVNVAARLLADAAPCVVAVRAPDYHGSLEDGWLSTVRALVGLAEPPRNPAAVDPRRVAVLAGSHLTPADVRELRSLIEAFDLAPTFVPDISALDGSRRGLNALSSGGVTVEELRALGGCAHALVLGSSLEPAARDLKERFAVPYTVFEAAYGIEATDRLIASLVLLSDAPAPGYLERDRRVLVDAMRDAHLAFAGARIALALETDLAISVGALLDELAVSPTAAVVPVDSARAACIGAEDVIVGGFADVPDDIDLLVASGHAERTAVARGAAHIVLGFPAAEEYGASRRLTVGYRGATALTDEIATALTRHRKEPTS